MYFTSLWLQIWFTGPQAGIVKDTEVSTSQSFRLAALWQYQLLLFSSLKQKGKIQICNITILFCISPWAKAISDGTLLPGVVYIYFLHFTPEVSSLQAVRRFGKNNCRDYHRDPDFKPNPNLCLILFTLSPNPTYSALNDALGISWNRQQKKEMNAGNGSWQLVVQKPWRVISKITNQPGRLACLCAVTRIRQVLKTLSAWAGFGVARQAWEALLVCRHRAAV